MWVAVAAVVVTVLAIGVIPFLVGNEETRPADTVVPSSLAESAPTTLAESTPTTLEELALMPGTWSIVPRTEGGLGEGGIRSVAVGGPGLVAVGSPVSGDEHGDAAVWTSVDGITWTQVPHDEEVFGDGNLESVTAGGPGLVAVGSSVVLTSTDGIVWSRVTDDDGTFDDSSIRSVTKGGPGLVAVGSAGEGAAVWTSVDGIVWSRVPHDEAAFGGSPTGGPSMWHVAVGGPGLVAVGIDWSGPDADAAVWTSVDGLTWTRVPHDEEVFGGTGHQAISGVTAAGPGLVAVGVERSGRMQGVVWTSVDGLTWTRVPPDESGSLDGGEMKSVVVGDSGLVAVGWIGWIGGPNSVAAVWTSPDGIVWSRVLHDEEAIGNGLMSNLINTDRGLVAVGTDGTNAAVWVRPSDQ
jgi:hypothetical protein